MNNGGENLYINFHEYKSYYKKFNEVMLIITTF